MIPGSIRAIHYGEVTGNDDPEKRGRIRVRCDTIVPDDELPFWIPPVFIWMGSSDGKKIDAAQLWIPDVGTIVELEMSVGQTGDPTSGFMSSDSPDIKYRGHALPGPEDLPNALKTNYPFRRGWVTKARHMFIFDDSSNGSVILAHGKGQVVEMDKNGNVTLKTANGNIKLELLDSGTAKLTATTKVVVEATTIELGEGATEDAIKGTIFGASWDSLVGGLTALASSLAADATGMTPLNTAGTSLQAVVAALSSAAGFKSVKVKVGN